MQATPVAVVGAVAFVTEMIFGSESSLVFASEAGFLTWTPLAVVTLVIAILLPVMSIQLEPPSTLYFMVLSTPLSLPPFSLSAVNSADGVVSFVFAVASVSVRLTAAVGVPETVICV